MHLRIQHQGLSQVKLKKAVEVIDKVILSEPCGFSEVNQKILKDTLDHHLYLWKKLNLRQSRPFLNINPVPKLNLPQTSAARLMTKEWTA